MNSLIEYIKHTAKQPMLQDDTDFNPQDYAGGNYDDAYVLGQEDGAIMFAQELVNKFLKDDS